MLKASAQHRVGCTNPEASTYKNVGVDNYAHAVMVA